MANIKSQIKRNRQNEKRRIRNRRIVGSSRTFLKKARQAIEDGGVSDAKGTVLTAISSLDRAVGKGVIHKNAAARRKSRLMKRLHALEKQQAE